MRKIAYNLDIGYCGCDEEGVTTVEDYMTNKDIDGMVHEMAAEYAQSWEGDKRLGGEWNEEGTEAFYENVCGSWEDYDPAKHGEWEGEET